MSACLYIQSGLQNFEKDQLCSITIAVCGDLCRVLDEEILPFCDSIMGLLINNLRTDVLKRSVKPPIFSCFGDIALAISAHFERYLCSAMQEVDVVFAKMNMRDEDIMDDVNQLRRSIFVAFSGILRGLKGQKAKLMIPYAPYLLKFVGYVSRDRSRDESVNQALVTAVVDLADVIEQWII